MSPLAFALVLIVAVFGFAALLALALAVFLRLVSKEADRVRDEELAAAARRLRYSGWRDLDARREQARFN